MFLHRHGWSYPESNPLTVCLRLRSQKLLAIGTTGSERKPSSRACRLMWRPALRSGCPERLSSRAQPGGLTSGDYHTASVTSSSATEQTQGILN